MSESTAYDTFKNNVSALVARARIDRIENVVLTGMPDVSCCLGGVDVWIELKSPTEPKRASTPLFGSNHKLSQDQKNWIKRHTSAGGKVFIYIETDKRRLLIDGVYADSINEMTVAELVNCSAWMGRRIIKDKLEWIRLVGKLRGVE